MVLLSPKRNRNNLQARNAFADPFSLFDEFFNGFNNSEMEVFTPRTDVLENEKNITVKCELPGLDENDISVSLENESVVIEGEKKYENEKDEKGYHHIERSYGSFKRVVPLGSEIDPDKIKAEFKKGLLTVEMPKAVEPEKTARKIEINKG